MIMDKENVMKQYVIAIYEGLLKIGQKIEYDAKIAGYIADWYQSQGYETQVFEYELWLWIPQR